MFSLSRKVNFDQNSEFLGLHFCANIKLCAQPSILANCLKIIDFPDWNVFQCMEIMLAQENHCWNFGCLCSGNRIRLKCYFYIFDFNFSNISVMWIKISSCKENTKDIMRKKEMLNFALSYILKRDKNAPFITAAFEAPNLLRNDSLAFKEYITEKKFMNFSNVEQVMSIRIEDNTGVNQLR